MFSHLLEGWGAACVSGWIAWCWWSLLHGNCCCSVSCWEYNLSREKVKHIYLCLRLESSLVNWNVCVVASDLNFSWQKLSDTYIMYICLNTWDIILNMICMNLIVGKNISNSCFYVLLPSLLWLVFYIVYTRSFSARHTGLSDPFFFAFFAPFLSLHPMYFTCRVEYGHQGVGVVSQQLYTSLTSLQMGQTEDCMGWTMHLN
jgi:hypothetical protein